MTNAEQTIAELKRRLAALAVEEQKIRTAIDSLCAVTGQPEVVTKQHQTSQTQSNQYFGRRPSVVAAAILKGWQTPATLDQLFAEFLRGGFEFKNKINKDVQKRSIAVAMGRQKAKFHKLDDGTWSLK